ncbi:MAG: hypothetical protein J6S87_05540 [Bacteroidales bacterium]|nr:hypothetical protein [Bacteroidales bacterium]
MEKQELTAEIKRFTQLLRESAPEQKGELEKKLIDLYFEFYRTSAELTTKGNIVDKIAEITVEKPTNWALKIKALEELQFKRYDVIVTLLDGTKLPKGQVPAGASYINENGQKCQKTLTVAQPNTKPEEKTSGFNLKNIKDKVSQKLDDTFVSRKTFNANPALIPTIADKILKHFKDDGFEVNSENNDDTVTLFLTNGDIFKTIAGLKTGLVVKIAPIGDSQIDIVSSIDNYKERRNAMVAGAAASLLSIPLAIPSIIGAVKQARLDEKPIEIATDVILNSKNI